MANKKTDTTSYLIDEILSGAMKQKATDVHLTIDMPPIIRVNGLLQKIKGFKTLDTDNIEHLISQLLNENLLTKLYQSKEIDTSYAVSDKNRYRVNVYFEKGKLAAALRFIPPTIPTIEELNLPPILYEFCKLPRGLVLVTGASGAGKTTTLASMINWINYNKNNHILTIEDPIEYVFKSNKALIHQREVNVDTKGWHRALRSTLRADVDVILIGEMRDYESVSLAIHAAENGHLVLGALHTFSATQTMDHIISIFPDQQQSQARMQLSAILEGVITQTLVNGADPTKRYPAVEILIANNAVRNTIREGKAHHIHNIIDTSADWGMISMEKALAELVNAGKVNLNEALGQTLSPDEMMRYVKRGKRKT